MDKKVIAKYVTMGIGALFSLGSFLISAKIQDDQIKDAVAEQVEEALKNRN